MNERFENVIAKFEQQWQSNTHPSILAAAKSLDDDADCLVELVLVDMEFRWRKSSIGKTFDDSLGSQLRLDDYQRVMPAIRAWPAFAAAEEYRIRRLWGDHPIHDHFLSRFPHHLLELIELLRQVDREINADQTHVSAPEKFAPATHDPRAPLAYSDFVLQEHLGTGGMGKVYRARQVSLDRTVAVKALLKSRQNSSDAIDQFLREGQLLGRLRHPNIIGVHGLGRFPGGGYFLVIDWIDGQDLATLINTSNITVARAIEIISTVCEAIQHAHDQEVIHCDLKPSNVMVSKDDQVYVTDFGLARLAHNRSPTGGTLAYMAPEQTDTTRGPITTTTDVFGIGGILYSLLTGRSPIDLDDANESESPIAPHPSDLNESVQQSLGDVCMKCLHRLPSERFSSAADVLNALTPH